MAEIIKVKSYGVETTATVVKYIPEQRKAKYSYTVYNHIIAYDGCTRELILDQEYPIGSQIPVKYLSRDPLFSVMLDDKRLSVWDQLNLRVMGTTNGNAGVFNFVITVLFFLILCFIITWLYRDYKAKKNEQRR